MTAAREPLELAAHEALGSLVEPARSSSIGAAEGGEGVDAVAEGEEAERIFGLGPMGGSVEHDAEGHRIRYQGHPLDLTRYEYGLLAALLARPGAVLSRAQLMDRVWQGAPETSDRTVDTHVKTLRAKLRDVAPGRDPIRTHRGLGYSLDAAG